MPPVLLFVVADLIVQLFQIVLEGHNLVLHCSYGVLKAHNIFIALLRHLSLVPYPVLRRLNLSLEALHRMLRSFVWVVLRLAAFSLLVDFLTLTQVDLLSFTEILIEHIYLPLLCCISCLHRLQFICHLFELSVFVIIVGTCLLELL